MKQRSLELDDVELAHAVAGLARARGRLGGRTCTCPPSPEPEPELEPEPTIGDVLPLSDPT